MKSLKLSVKGSRNWELKLGGMFSEKEVEKEAKYKGR